MMVDGKWVTDDYDEDVAMAKCVENGFTPHALAHDDDIVANAMSTVQLPGRPSERQAMTLTPFYTVGGPTTHFAGSGVNPWSEAGWGNKRAKLRGSGINEENWMLKSAEDCRALDVQLREYRAERLVELEGVDATRGWVYAQESKTDERLPEVERKSAFELTPAKVDDEALTPLPGEEEVFVDKTPGGRIVVETLTESDRRGGGSWRAGTIRAVYEVGCVSCQSLL